MKLETIAITTVAVGGALYIAYLAYTSLSGVAHAVSAALLGV